MTKMSAYTLACGEQTHFSALASRAEKIFSRRVKQEPKNASALRRLLIRLLRWIINSHNPATRVIILKLVSKSQYQSHFRLEYVTNEVRNTVASIQLN